MKPEESIANRMVLITETLEAEYPNDYHKFSVHTVITQKFVPPFMNSDQKFWTTLHSKMTYADQESEVIPVQEVTEEWIREQAAALYSNVDKDSWIGGMHMPEITSLLSNSQPDTHSQEDTPYETE